MENKHLKNLDIFNNIQVALIDIYHKNNNLTNITNFFDKKLCNCINNNLNLFISDANNFITIIQDDILKNTINKHIFEFTKLINTINNIHSNQIYNVIKYIQNKIYQDQKIIEDLNNLPNIPNTIPSVSKNALKISQKYL